MSYVTKADDDAVLKDGQTLRVSIFMMDAGQRAVWDAAAAKNDLALHRPGYAFISDAERDRRVQQQAAYNASIERRWRASGTATEPAATHQQTGDGRPGAYAAYEQRLTNAWRHR